MTVSSHLLIDGLTQLQLLDHGSGAHIEVLANDVSQLNVAQLAGAEGVHQNGHRLCHADGVGQLQLALVSQTGGNQILGDVTGVVSAGAVHLGGILTGESAAAVTGIAAVGVHDDLTAGQTGVALGAADDEAAGGVDVDLGVGGDHTLGNGLIDDLFNDSLADLLQRSSVQMLGGDDDVVKTLGVAVFVVDNADLALAVGQDEGHLAVLADFRQLAGQLVGEGDGGGHELLGLAAGITEHHALVAGTDQVVLILAAFAVFHGAVNAHGDVGALTVQSGQHSAGLVVKALAGTVVTDLLDGFADDLFHRDVGGGGHFAHDHDHAGGGAGLTGHAGHGVLGQNSVQNAVGYLVAQFVGMAFGNAFRSEQSLVSHLCLPLFLYFLLFSEKKNRLPKRSLCDVGYRTLLIDVRGTTVTLSGRLVCGH